MIVNSADTLAKMLSDYGSVFAFDTETKGKTPPGCVPCKDEALVLDRADMHTFSACGEVKGREVSLVCFTEEEYGKKHIPKHSMIKAMRGVMEDKSVTKVAHNMNYDANVMNNLGISVNNQECTSVLGRCADENMEGSLKVRAFLVGMALRRTKQIDFSVLDKDTVDYAEEDAIACWRLFNHYKESEGFPSENRWIYENQEKPLIPVNQRMEQRGMLLDVPYVHKMAVEMKKELVQVEKDIYNLAGCVFNIRSTKQLCEVLYERLKIPAPKPTGKSGLPSTDEKTLFYLQIHHKIVPKILEFRHLSKLYDTYINPESGLLSYADPQGWIHYTLNQVGAKTFRYSSSNPNIQNIPARSEYGKKIRRAFTAPKGHTMFVPDYSMFELIMLCNFCRDPEMSAVLGDPKGDLHAKTSKGVGVERPVAKTINFGTIYGMGPKKLQVNLTMQGHPVSKKEARGYIDKFFSLYSYIDVFKANLLKFHQAMGYVKYLSGRVRKIAELESTVPWEVKSGERMLLNNVIQGSCADWTKQAMLRIEDDAYLKRKGYFQVSQVHDEIIGYAPNRTPFTNSSIMERLHFLMKQPVENPVIKLTIPIRVGSGIGKNWGEAK